MSRRLTDTLDYAPYSSVVGTITRDTTHQYSGAACGACLASTGSVLEHPLSTTLGRRYFARFAIRLASLPPGTRALWRVADVTGTVLEISITSEGQISLWNGVAGAHPTEGEFFLKAEEWGVIETEWMIAAAGKGKVAWRANGKTIAAEQEMSMRNSGIIVMRTGNIDSTARTIYVDRIAVNDERGAVNNSWPELDADAPPASGCLWGALMAGDHYSPEWEKAPYQTSTWDTFEKHAGRKVGIVHGGDPWLKWDGYGEGATDLVHERGAVPLKSLGSTVAKNELAEVLEGKFDTQIDAWAEAARDYGHTVYLRPWWEMNGFWFPWGRAKNYIEAWRYLHGRVKAIAPNVEFIWCVNTIWEDPESDPGPWYPGDAYVDWVGIDGYTGENPLKNIGWRSPTNLFLPTYERLQEIAPGKPMMICETGCSEYGGNKAAWIANLLGNVLPYTLPEIKALVWFNWDIEEGEGKLDWAIESSEGAQEAFAAGIANSYYTRLPIRGETKIHSRGTFSPATRRVKVGGEFVEV